MSVLPPASVRSVTEAVLEGKKALTLPMRFINGAVSLGPLKVADVSPLGKTFVTTDRHCGILFKIAISQGILPD